MGRLTVRIPQWGVRGIVHAVSHCERAHPLGWGEQPADWMRDTMSGVA